MADIVFWQYPETEAELGPSGWTIDPLASVVDDPHDAPDDSNFAMSQPVGTPLTWRATWAMTPPAAAVAITGVSLYARLWAHSQNSTPHDLTNVRGVAIVGGTIYYTATSQTVLGTTGSSGPNPVTYLLGDFATNPDTGLAWTIPELQAAVFGVEYEDVDVGSNTPQTLISSFYAQIASTTIAQSIEGRRAEGSHYLLTLGRLHGTFEVMAPPGFVDLEPGQVISVIDRLGPAASGQGWGRKLWERRDALVLENEWTPMTRKCRIVLFDLRFFRVSLWWQPLTDLPYTEVGEGIPYLDSGGGYTLARASTAYVRKQHGDQLYTQVPIDFEKWTADGLAVGGGGDLTATLNNSFSLGTGSGASEFTYWTKVETGSGDFAADTADFLFDAVGLRRSAIIATGNTAGSTAYLEQTHPVVGPGYARVALLYKHDGVPEPAQWQLQRGADGWYWDNTADAWTATATANLVSLANPGRLDGAYSRVIPFASGSDSYTLRVGYVAAGATAPAQIHLYVASLVFSAALADVSGFRSLEVTTTAPSSVRVRDDLQLANAAPVRWWDPARGGQIELRILALFDHVELIDGDEKPLLFCQGNDSDDFDLITYVRVSATEGRWRLQRQTAGVDVFADVAVTSGFPATFSSWKLAARWNGPDEELNVPAGTLWICANGVWSDPATAVVQDMGEASTVHLAWNPVTSVAGDYVLQAIRVRKLCLTDDETLRELG